MASSPPLPPSPSLNDLLVPPVPHIIDIPECGDSDVISNVTSDNASLNIFPPIDASSPLAYVPPPVQVQSPRTPIEFFFPGTSDKCYIRGRSRSRSPSSRDRSVSPPRCHSPIRTCGNPIYVTPPTLCYPSSPSRSCTPDSSRSPSPRPRRRRYSYRSRTPSPIRRSSYTYSPPQIIYPPPPAPVVPVPNMTPPPPMPPFVYRDSIPMSEPVDILTFHYNKNMAYAPAAKSYDEAMDNVLELWPDLREFDRDRIHLFVGGANQLVRVPKMAWQLVMWDLPRYEIMHVQVDQLPPPPQYQSDGKGNWTSGDEKKDKKQTARSRGFFSSIKRIFWR